MVCFILFIPGTILGFVAVFAALCRHDAILKEQSQLNLALIEQNIKGMPDSPRKTEFEVILKKLRAELK